MCGALGFNNFDVLYYENVVCIHKCYCGLDNTTPSFRELVF